MLVTYYQTNYCIFCVWSEVIPWAIPPLPFSQSLRVGSRTEKPLEIPVASVPCQCHSRGWEDGGFLAQQKRMFRKFDCPVDTRIEVYEVYRYRNCMELPIPFPSLSGWQIRHPPPLDTASGAVAARSVAAWRSILRWHDEMYLAASKTEMFPRTKVNAKLSADS